MYIPSEKEVKIKSIKPETVEEFLARGGKIITTYEKKTKKVSHKTDAQTLLDAAMGTEHEAEMIKFLASQGIDVV